MVGGSLVFTVLLAFTDFVADALEAERNLGNQDYIGAAGDSAMGGDPTSVAAHHLAHQHAFVAGGSAAQPVERISRERDRGIEAESDVGAGDIVVDGLGDAYDGYAAVLKLLGNGE